MKYMTKLLISGVPGAGKTTLANYLESDHGFFHVDMEGDEFDPRKEFNKDPANFLGRLATHEDVVLSWGFRPFKDRSAVEKLMEAGFSVIWLDGDRAVSFSNFMKRENNNLMSEVTYYEQMQAIITTGIVAAIGPVVINPFTDAGEFRPVEEIADQVLGSNRG